MKPIPFYHTALEGSFWGEKQRISRTVTLDAVYDRFSETKRFDALRCDREQQEQEGWKAHIFWDSDVAKWIEGVAFALELQRDERLEAMADRLIANMCEHQRENGYFNSYYNTYRPDEMLVVRGDHELYCLGHLIEAAVAYSHATGKNALLDLVERYVQLVIRVFMEEKSAPFVTPGHEEIELALVKLYHATGKKPYLELAKFFIEQRGCNELDLVGYYDFATPRYAQDHLPVREQSTAEGHSVRVMYLCMAMADLAKEYGDESLFKACDTLFRNVTEKRMYITGGVGSTHLGEAFTVDYDLNNEQAYTETCATVGLALFCRRMSAIKPLGVYGDVAEQALYNGSISGVSIQGDAFFYENPLAFNLKKGRRNFATTYTERNPITQRLKVFGCSCCPPNILRFVNSIADFLYTEEQGTLYVHHYMNGTTTYEGKTIRMITDYPSNGAVRFEVDGGFETIAIRVPGWCDDFTASAPYEMKDGYAYFRNVTALEFDFHMKPRFVVSAPGVHENAGKTALMYGPVVYCLEGVDHETDIFSLSVNIKVVPDAQYSAYFGLPVFTAEGYAKVDDGRLYPTADSVTYERTKLTFIPYYGMENRGETDMTVWVPMQG